MAVNPISPEMEWMNEWMNGTPRRFSPLGSFQTSFPILSVSVHAARAVEQSIYDSQRGAYHFSKHSGCPCPILDPPVSSREAERKIRKTSKPVPFTVDTREAVSCTWNKPWYEIPNQKYHSQFGGRSGPYCDTFPSVISVINLRNELALSRGK